MVRRISPVRIPSTSAVIPKSATFKNGVALVQVTFATTGDQTITATDSSTSSMTGVATIDVTAPDVATQFYMAVKPTLQSGVTTMVELVALDADGYVVKNYDGTVNLTSSDSGAKFSSSQYSTVTTANGVSSVTFQNGVAIVDVTFATAGPQTIVATDSTTSSLTSTDTVTVVAPEVPTQYYIAVKSTRAGGRADDDPTGIAGCLWQPGQELRWHRCPDEQRFEGDILVFFIFHRHDSRRRIKRDVQEWRGHDRRDLCIAGKQSIIATDSTTSGLTSTQSITVAPAASAASYTVSYPVDAWNGQVRHAGDRETGCRGLVGTYRNEL